MIKKSETNKTTEPKKQEKTQKQQKTPKTIKTTKTTKPAKTPKPTKNKKVESPKPPVNKKKKRFIVEMDGEEKTDTNENRYSTKLKYLLDKIKNQHTFVDNGIRFGWKK